MDGRRNRYTRHLGVNGLRKGSAVLDRFVGQVRTVGGNEDVRVHNSNPQTGLSLLALTYLKNDRSVLVVLYELSQYGHKVQGWSAAGGGIRGNDLRGLPCEPYWWQSPFGDEGLVGPTMGKS